MSYVEQVLNFITADYPVDTSRVYAIGMNKKEKDESCFVLFCFVLFCFVLLHCCVGHSNGGMFISDLVVSLGHR